MDNPMSGAPAYLVCLIENIEGRSKLRPKQVAHNIQFVLTQ